MWCLPVLAWDLKDGGQRGRVSVKDVAHLHKFICSFTHDWSRIKAGGQVPQLTWKVFKIFDSGGLVLGNLTRVRLTISATFWLIRMMSMSSRRMKLLRVSCEEIGMVTSRIICFRRFVVIAHLYVRNGSVLVHHHEVWPPRIHSYFNFLLELLWNLFLSSSPIPPRRKPTQVSWIRQMQINETLYSWDLYLIPNHPN